MKIRKNALVFGVMLLVLSACTIAKYSSRIDNNSTQEQARVSTSVECPIADYKIETFKMINSLRSKAQSCGVSVGELTWNTQLEAAAAVHSNDMATNNYIAHSDASGYRVGARVINAGYFYSYVGENIAAKQASVDEVFNLPNGHGWMSSKSHCANIMKASHKNIGVSCKFNPNSTHEYYWTLVMAD
jgi:uncharacterized protein YkwD